MRRFVIFYTDLAELPHFGIFHDAFSRCCCTSCPSTLQKRTIFSAILVVPSGNRTHQSYPLYDWNKSFLFLTKFPFRNWELLLVSFDFVLNRDNFHSFYVTFCLQPTANLSAVGFESTFWHHPHPPDFIEKHIMTVLMSNEHEWWNEWRYYWHDFTWSYINITWFYMNGIILHEWHDLTWIVMNDKIWPITIMTLKWRLQNVEAVWTIVHASSFIGIDDSAVA
jgi:hypothetical protein